MIVARLRKPHDGLFSGTIDALDTVNNTYRITFERAGFGTYSVPDVDVVVRIITHVPICSKLIVNQQTLVMVKSWNTKASVVVVVVAAADGAKTCFIVFFLLLVQ